MTMIDLNPVISPDPETTPTSLSYTYIWTGLPATDGQGNPYTYYATELEHPPYTRHYEPLVTIEGVEYCGTSETGCLIANIAPLPTSTSLSGFKQWVGGLATKPVVWLQLMQSENGGPAKPYLPPVKLDGVADAGCTSNCEKLPWQIAWLNVPIVDDYMKLNWTYTVKEVDASGNDWVPEHFTKVESGLTVTNTYVPLTLIDPPVAFKKWENFSGPYPTVWMHLYRQIPGGNPVAVGSPVPLDGVAGGDCTLGCEVVAWSARWEGVDATDLQGNPYVYFVKETNASGADWVPDNFIKTEVGMTVTNTYSPAPTATPIVTIPKTGDGSQMAGLGAGAFVSLLIFIGLQIASRKKRKI